MSQRDALESLSAGLVVRKLRVDTRAVVLVKGIVEAHDGLAQVFAERGGDLTIAAMANRENELAELVSDLAREFQGILLD